MARLTDLLESLSDAQLLFHLHDLARRDHNLEAEFVAHLGEVDARRLYIEQAFSSMFEYCVHVLHFDEGVAYKRIAVAALLEQVRKRKIGSCSTARFPRASTASDARSNTPSRHIPAVIRCQVWARDGGRRIYASPQGRHESEQDLNPVK